MFKNTLAANRSCRLCNSRTPMHTCACMVPSIQPYMVALRHMILDIFGPFLHDGSLTSLVYYTCNTCKNISMPIHGHFVASFPYIFQRNRFHICLYLRFTDVIEERPKRPHARAWTEVPAWSKRRQAKTAKIKTATPKRNQPLLGGPSPSLCPPSKGDRTAPKAVLLLSGALSVYFAV